MTMGLPMEEALISGSGFARAGRQGRGNQLGRGCSGGRAADRFSRRIDDNSEGLLCRIFAIIGNHGELIGTGFGGNPAEESISVILFAAEP